jgi:hypothetical protein
MEKREFGWCDHVNGIGMRVGVGNVLRIESTLPVFIRWKGNALMLILCRNCYQDEFLVDHIAYKAISTV